MRWVCLCLKKLQANKKYAATIETMQTMFFDYPDQPMNFSIVRQIPKYPRQYAMSGEKAFLIFIEQIREISLWMRAAKRTIKLSCASMALFSMKRVSLCIPGR